MRTLKAAGAWVRARSPFLDHLVRAVVRYQADMGDRLAAAVTFYWFLSLFPVLLVAIYVFTFVNGDSAARDVQRGLSGYLPAQLVATISTTIDQNAGKAGVIGLIGLLVSGLGWIDGLRGAIRAVWHHEAIAANIVLRRGIDVLALVGLFATIGISVFVTGLAGSGPRFLLEQLGVDETGANAVLFLKVAGLLLAGLADVALFLFLFLRLARVPTSLRDVLQGAVFGAVGFGVLKLVGGYYVQRTTTRGEATYGTFAVVVGLLLFLNLVSRLLLLSAAFAVTDPYDSDTTPSGSAGAPRPPVGPGSGRIGAKEVAVEKSWSAKSHPVLAEQPVPVPEPMLEPVPEPLPESMPTAGAKHVQLAGRVTAAAAGLVLVAVALYVLKTARGLLRR